VSNGSSNVWQPTNISGSQGGWRLQTAGGATTVSNNSSVSKCLDSGDGIKYSVYEYSQFTWTAPDGTARVFPITTYKDSFGYCYTDTPTGNALAEDSSGYHMYVTNYTKATVYAKDGTLVEDQLQPSTSYTMKDPNGNYFYTNNGNVVDTLGRTVVTYVANGSGCSASYCYNILTAQGTQQILVTTTTVNVNTAFYQTGVTEYSGSFTAIQSITLPDGSSYGFTYDSGTSAGNFGLLKTITLPTGGTVTYAWTTFSDSTGSNYRWVLTRAVSPGGTWTYAQTKNVPCPSSAPSGSTCQSVEVYRPSTDDAIYTFVLNNGGWNAETQYYASGGSTLLETVLNTYDFSQTCQGCTGPAYIRKVTAQSQLPSAGGATVTNQTTYTYDTAQMGDITAIKQWKYVSGSSPTFSSTPDRETDSTYAQWGQAYCANGTQNTSILENLDRLSSTTVKVGGTQVAQTNISYDTTGLTSVTGITNHDDSCYGASNTVRGNPTLIQGWISGSSYASTTNYYDTTGQATSSTDPNSNQTTFSYVNANAYLGSITKGGLTTTFTYDSNTGLVTSVIDPNSQTTGFTYDEMDRLTLTSFPDNGSVSANYPSETEQDIYTAVTSSTSRHDQLLLDDLGRVKRSVLVNDPDPGGATYVDTSYDGAGRVESVSNPYRGSSPGGDSFAYDGLDRPNSVTHADTNVAYTYYGAAVGGAGGATSQLCSSGTYGLGFPTLLVDEAGKKRQNWADGFGRTVEVDEPGSSGNLTVGTCYKYDGLDNLIEVDQGAETRTYAYDGLSRLTSVATPETANCAITYGYDGNGNITSRTAPKPNQTSCSTTVTTTYSYGPLNQVAGKTYSDGSTSVGYSYGATACLGLSRCYNKGRRTGMTDASGQTAWSYDPMGRVWVEQRTIAGITKTISYTYNLDGSPYSVTYPSGRTITYAPSVVGRAVSAVDSANSINYAQDASYAPQGGLASMLNGQSSNPNFGGITFNATYNNRLMPSALSASSSAGTVLNLSYQYFANDNVNVETNNRSGMSGRSVTYGYDNLNRWNSATSTATSGSSCWGQAVPPWSGDPNSYGYDRYANLMIIDGTQSGTGCSQPTLSVSASTSTNQITSSGFSYDAAGNLLGDGYNAFQWNDEGRPASANGTTYTYDGDGRRVEKSSATLYWDGLAETDTSGNTTNEYIFFAGARIARRDGSGNIYYYFHDQLGTSRTIAYGNGPTPGALCYDSDYYPTGGERNYLGTCGQDFRFADMEQDSETTPASYHTLFRQYTTNYGRWLSPDPVHGGVTNPQSLNRYAYALNNPCSMVDPLGLDACQLNVSINNQTGQNLDLGAIGAAIKQIFDESSVGQINQVGVNFVTSGQTDFTLTFNNNGVAGGPSGNATQGGTTGQVFANLYPPSVYLGYTNTFLGLIGAHEMGHGLANVPDLPFKQYGATLMSIDSNLGPPDTPGWYTPVYNETFPQGLLFTPYQVAAMFSKCPHKHPSVTPLPLRGGGSSGGGSGGTYDMNGYLCYGFAKAFGSWSCWPAPPSE
jgi:RHS repeat-associated protein